MQSTFLNAGSRSCLNVNVSISSRCTSELTPRTLTRSFGNGKRKINPETASLLDPRSRDRRLKAAGDKALAAKYERNTYNKNYRERRKDRAEAKKEKEDDGRTYEVAGVYMRAARQPARDALKAMKEDWALGPLAPKRDVGERAGKMGTVELGLHQLHSLTKTQIEDVKARMGNNVFKAHDRVVVLTGRDRGKIGTIMTIDEEKMSATIDGINKVAVHVPEYMAMHDSDQRSFRVLRRDVRLDELKLVVPVRDPDTNKLKDVVLDRMDLKEVLVHTPGKVAQIKAGTQDLPTDQDEFVPRESEKAYELEDYKWKTLRYIPSTNTEIVDHSEKDDAHDYDQEYHAHDTLAIAVDEQTYWPEIIEHPMPSSVLKEISLRDRKEITKYSEKIEDAIKERAEAKMRKQFELEDRIRTPLQELKLELKRTQREALKARKAEFVGAVDSEAAQKPVKESRSRLTVYEDGAEVEKLSPAKTQPVSDIVVTIGQAMARNWAQNPHVVTGNRKRLLEKVLEQEGATPAANSEACV